MSFCCLWSSKGVTLDPRWGRGELGRVSPPDDRARQSPQRTVSLRRRESRAFRPGLSPGFSLT